jgi:hypothetical protein
MVSLPARAPRSMYVERNDAHADEPATAREDVVEAALGLRASVAVDEMPLATTLEPDAARLRKRLGELVAICYFLVDRMQDANVSSTRRLQRVHAAPVGGIDGIAASRGDVDDERIRPAGKLDELAEDFRPHRAPAHHNDRSWCRAHLGAR